MESCLEATDRLDHQLNVFVTRVDREVLLQRAADVDRQRQAGLELGPLAGIPIALKDIYFTSDLPTTASSKVLAGHRTNEDAFTVTKLRQAGALIVGKLQTHELLTARPR
jgi:aspartyl-tRNA(Asn)/glutamyl-tRNA(Gln) amidotransferase subunit A